MQQFIPYFCDAHNISFPAAPAAPAAARPVTMDQMAYRRIRELGDRQSSSHKKARERRLRVKLESEEEAAERAEDLQDSVREAMSRHGHAMLLETMAFNLEELPYDVKAADTPFGLFLAQILEPVLLRRRRCIQRYRSLFESRDASDSLVVVQCRFCHAEGGKGALKENAVVVVDVPASNPVKFSAQLIEILYKHTQFCPCLPESARRKLFALGFLPRTPQFNRFARSFHGRCQDWLPWLEQQQQESTNSQPDEGRRAPKIWVSLTTDQLRQLTEKNGGVVPYADMMDPNQNAHGPGSAVMECEAPYRCDLLSGEIGVPSFKNPMLPKPRMGKRKRTEEQPGCKVLEVEEMQP